MEDSALSAILYWPLASVSQTFYFFTFLFPWYEILSDSCRLPYCGGESEFQGNRGDAGSGRHPSGALVSYQGRQGR